MKVLALTRYSRLGASSRLRTFQYVPFCAKLGVDIKIFPLLGDDYLGRFYEGNPLNWLEIFKSYFFRLKLLLTSNKYDLLWIEKELFPNLPAWFEQILNSLGIRYIVDYDDAIFHNYDSSRNPFKRMLSEKIDKVMRAADVVICGNEYICEKAIIAGARKTEILPTVIDLERYKVLDVPLRNRLVIGWIGSPYTVKYLNLVAPALQILAKEIPFQLRVIGADFAIEGVNVECHPWREDLEVAHIHEFDVGIMPLPDSPFERGKCGYKLIQYMACGKPVVASPVGVNKKIVSNDVGILALDKADWVKALRLLFLNRGDGITMGRQGRIVVEGKYCVQATSTRLVELFHEATK